MMQLTSLLTSVAAYNTWANQSLLNWAASQPADELSQDLPNGQGSILKMLNHIWSVEEFWLNVVQGKDPFASQRYTATEFHAEEIMPGLAAQSQALQAYIATLSDEAYSEVIAVDFPWVKGSQQRYELLHHMFNHSTYHRGQLTSMARRLGWTGAPMTDYNFYNLVALVPQS
jgi:uncharacterized damage-inducible protein DinB